PLLDKKHFIKAIEGETCIFLNLHKLSGDKSVKSKYNSI
ncbi:unnamed protein product, partial [marine sediment metagenome]